MLKLFVAAAVLLGLSFQWVQPASGAIGVIDLSSCYEGKLPVALSFNATKNSDESATLRFGLHDNKTGQPVPAASYIVNITEAENNKPLLKEVFHAENGTLALNVIHANMDNETVVTGARQEGFIGAWIANSTAQPITIHSPDISLGKTYRIQVYVFGLEDIRCLFPPDQIPKAGFVWNPQDGSMRDVAVVPEFSSALLPILTAAIIGAGVAYGRVSQRLQKK